MSDYLDRADVDRDAEYERDMAEAGRVLDPVDDDADLCEVCGEGDAPFDDVVANFWTGERNALAHELCADVYGWRLA